MQLEGNIEVAQERVWGEVKIQGLSSGVEVICRIWLAERQFSAATCGRIRNQPQQVGFVFRFRLITEYSLRNTSQIYQQRLLSDMQA